MDNSSFDRVHELLASSKHVAVVVAENPSSDSLSAALSLALSLEKSGKKTSVFSPTITTVSQANLFGVHKVKQSANGVTNGFVISLPYKQGSIEKISYDIVGDRINLTVVPGPQGLTFTTDDITYQTPHEQADLVFAIAFSSEEQLVSAYPIETDVPLVVIDHMLHNTEHGTVSLVDSAYSSDSEIVATLLTSLNLPIDSDIAQNLLSGIVDETENFQRADTSVFAFELASMLLQKGAKRVSPDRPVAPRGNNLSTDENRGWDVGSTPRFAQRGQDQGRGNPKPHGGQYRERPAVPVGGGQVPGFGGKAVQKGATPRLSGNSPQQQSSGGTNASPTPKDWFEPKIYSGKTPIS